VWELPERGLREFTCMRSCCPGIIPRDIDDLEWVSGKIPREMILFFNSTVIGSVAGGSRIGVRID